MLLKLLATRRFNYIDLVVGIEMTRHLVNGSYWTAVTAFVVGLMLSAMAEILLEREKSNA